MMNKHTLPLGIFLLLLLLFSGCPNQATGKAGNAAPAGMGYFLLRIEGAQSSRTIMPVMPEAKSLYYKLEFYKSGTAMDPKVTGPIPYEKLSDPVLLEAGTWDVTVSAYKDANGTQMTAQVIKTGIIIDDGQTTTSDVTLEPFRSGSGQGTFSWGISYPSEVSMARMTIAKTPNGTDILRYFTGGTPLSVIKKVAGLESDDS